MNKPTGKLKFAYDSITNLESKVERLQQQLSEAEAARAGMEVIEELGEIFQKITLETRSVSAFGIKYPACEKLLLAHADSQALPTDSKG